MSKLLPRDLKKAVDRLEAEPSRSWTLDDLATVSGVRAAHCTSGSAGFSRALQWSSFATSGSSGYARIYWKRLRERT